jgi:4'-phosphopantetheinyl transferase EntD
MSASSEARLGDTPHRVMPNKDPVITAVLASLAPAGVRIEHRIIAPGDEDALLDAEARYFANSIARVRRQSGAARLAAREILVDLGIVDAALPRRRGGPPEWPRGIVGSLAHDDEVAVAAVARGELYSGIGIDVEPALPLPPELIEKVATQAERRRYATTLVESRVLFAVKEAIYKAQYPIHGEFLDFDDIEVDLTMNQAVTRGGRRLAVAVATLPRIFALAFIPCASSFK